MKNKILGVAFATLFLTTGCTSNETMENIKIKTTSYPIEYITNFLYQEHASSIGSIYPDNVDINNYKLTNKQIKDFSNNDLFIYNGASNEPDYAIELLNTNKNIKIIDAAKGMDFSNDIEELWLDPFNFLMLAQNIKSGFNEYISDPYLKEEVEDKYDELNLQISELDVDFKTSADNAVNKTIIVSDNLFKFLEKYGFTIISLEDDENLTPKTIEEAKELIDNGTIEFIFLKDGEEQNKIVESLIEETDVKTETLHTLSNLTEQERDNNQDYLTIMKSNIEKLRKELYK